MIDRLTHTVILPQEIVKSQSQLVWYLDKSTTTAGHFHNPLQSMNTYFPTLSTLTTLPKPHLSLAVFQPRAKWHVVQSNHAMRVTGHRHNRSQQVP